MGEQPVLTTPRLILRPFRISDAPDVQRLAGASEVADTTLNVPHPYVDGVAEEWISGHPARWEQGLQVAYAVTQDGSLSGCVSLVITSRHRRAELGYWMGVPFWNHGYTTEASAALLVLAFD